MQPRQIGDRDIVFAGERSQREEPLLDLFEGVRVEIERVSGDIQQSERLSGLIGGALGGGDRIVEQPLRPVAGAFEPPQGAGESALGAALAVALAAKLRGGLGDRLANTLGVLQ